MKSIFNNHTKQKFDSINVLSLFDGMSGGQQAFNNLNIKIDNYLASEIDTPAIDVTRYNFPNTKFIGSVTDIEIKHIKDDIISINDIELSINNLILIGGSPCTNFSFIGKKNGMTTSENIEITSLDKYLQLKKENFKFEGQSYLFWEYKRILSELQKINPNILFLLENVIMDKKWEKILTSNIGVKPIRINSKIFSAQSRDRLYWTNINNCPIELPSESKLVLKDILDKNVPNDIYLSKRKLLLYNGNWCGKSRYRGHCNRYNKKSSCILTQYDIAQNVVIEDINIEKVLYQENISNERLLKLLNTTEENFKNNKIRMFTINEVERLQTVKEDYTKFGLKSNGDKYELTYPKRFKMIGNGWTIKVIEHIFSYLLFDEKKYENNLDKWI